MKRIIKVYMLIQLLALPFMLAGLGKAFDSSAGPGDSALTGVSATATAQAVLCEAIKGEVQNAVQDNIQQLRYITAELYGEDIAEECFTTPVAGGR